MKNFNLDTLLEAMLKVSDRVSDLNFSVGHPPQVELDGDLKKVSFPLVTEEQLEDTLGRLAAAVSG